MTHTPDEVRALLASIAELAVGLQEDEAVEALVRLDLYEDLFDVDQTLLNLDGDVGNSLAGE